MHHNEGRGSVMKKIVSLHQDGYYQKKAADFFNQAMFHIAKQDYQTASKLLQEACRFDETNAEYHYYAGVSLYLIDQLEKAVDFLQVAAENHPDNIDYAYTLGTVLFRKKSYKEALIVFDYIVSVHGHIDSIFYVGKCFVELGQFEKAVEKLGEVLPKRGNQYEVYFELGCAYMGMFEFRDAQACFETSIRLNPDHIIAYYYLSKIFLKKGEHDHSIHILTKLKNLHPDETSLVDKNIDVINMLKRI